MSAITATIDVARPASEVYAYATDPSRFSDWQNGVVDGAMAAAGEASVGDRCLIVPLVIRREARKEMPANLAALKQNLEGPISLQQ